MGTKKLKVLFVAEQCNPDWSSVPLVGFHYYRTLNELADVTLVTHGRNRTGLENANLEPHKIVYIDESSFAEKYYRWVLRWVPKGMNNWPLYHVVTYPIFAEFNRKVYRQFHQAVEDGEYDIVHSMTPMMPRYPVKLAKACDKTPLLLGPVNGGIPFPEGFSEIANQEFAYLNWLRPFGRWLIPGYKKTYERAAKILSGSTYTRNLIQKMFSVPNDRIEVHFENGIADGVFKPVPTDPAKETLDLLFVGRLVPYKCADVVVEAISRLPADLRDKVNCTIVGDGPQKEPLQEQVNSLGLQSQINLTGWVEQTETATYYQKADVFCFPSIREFGGAVVLEAMACGLPSIVVNYGGIGEYVTEETGFKIEPVSRSQLVIEVSECIQKFLEDRELLDRMSQQALAHSETFRWSNKAQQLLDIYEELLGVSSVPQEAAVESLSTA